MIERWTPIMEAPGYIVSTFGHVRSPGHFAGVHRSWFPGKFLKLTSKRGYLHVGLYRESRVKIYRVNRLVLTNFSGMPPTPQHQAAHLNGDRADNRLTNLAWKTPKENHADQLVHGTRINGSRCPWAKLTELRVAEIVRRFEAGESQRALAKEFGIGASSVHRIVRKPLSVWRHVKRLSSSRAVAPLQDGRGRPTRWISDRACDFCKRVFRPRRSSTRYCSRLCLGAANGVRLRGVQSRRSA